MHAFSTYLGASDDMVSCAIMMEALRALSAADVPLKHAIVFNFNGAEEAILQVSVCTFRK